MIQCSILPVSVCHYDFRFIGRKPESRGVKQKTAEEALKKAAKTRSSSDQRARRLANPLGAVLPVGACRPPHAALTFHGIVGFLSDLFFNLSHERCSDPGLTKQCQSIQSLLFVDVCERCSDPGLARYCQSIQSLLFVCVCL